MKKEYITPEFDFRKIEFTVDVLGDSKTEIDTPVVTIPDPPSDPNAW